MERSKSIIDLPPVPSFDFARKAIEMDLLDGYPQRYFLRVRQTSDNLRIAVEGLMMQDSRRLVEGELAQGVRLLPGRVDRVIKLFGRTDISYSRKQKEQKYGFTARWVMYNIIELEQERLMKVSKYPELAVDDELDQSLDYVEDRDVGRFLNRPPQSSEPTDAPVEIDQLTQ